MDLIVILVQAGTRACHTHASQEAGRGLQSPLRICARLYLVALPGAVISALAIYDWIEQRRKKPK